MKWRRGTRVRKRRTQGRKHIAQFPVHGKWLNAAKAVSALIVLIVVAYFLDLNSAMQMISFVDILLPCLSVLDRFFI